MDLENEKPVSIYICIPNFKKLSQYFLVGNTDVNITCTGAANFCLIGPLEATQTIVQIPELKNRIALDEV